jgi:hypothetical protein
MFKKTRDQSKLLFSGALLFVALPASGFVQISSNSFIGNVPDGLYDGEPCFPEVIDIFNDPVVGIDEVRVNTLGVVSDGDPDTFLTCYDQGNETVACMAGFPDGTIANCYDIVGPHVLPEPGDQVFLLIDPYDNLYCDLIVQRKFGEDNPACREETGTGGSTSTGGTGSSGGSSSGTVCDATNVDAILNTGQSTTIANNACIRLVMEPSWSSVNPAIQPMSGTSSYPVPFTYTSCKGSGSASLLGDWQTTFLVDGPNPAANFGCDIFLQLTGNGQSLVKFSYFD